VTPFFSLTLFFPLRHLGVGETVSDFGYIEERLFDALKEFGFRRNTLCTLIQGETITNTEVKSIMMKKRITVRFAKKSR